MTNHIRIGPAFSPRSCRLVWATRLAPLRLAASSKAVLLVAACASLLGGGRLLAHSGSGAKSSSAGSTPSVTKLFASAIQIEPVEIGEVKMPPEFRIAVYENLIARVSKSGKFQHVYRDGDRAAADVPDLVIVRMTVIGFKQGSLRERDVTTFAGTTSVDLGVQVTDRGGKVLVDRDVVGKVRFFGGNLRATSDFSKKVAAILGERF